METERDDLLWFQRSKARDGLYETPKEVAQAMYEAMIGISDIADKKPNVLDPCAGSGRLLTPFKKDGFDVIGIEYNEVMYDKLKRNLGSKYSRGGNAIDYYVGGKVSGKFNFVVMNPPFGLRLSTEGLHFETGEDEIESQTAFVELAHKALPYYGTAIVGLILPTSTWSNAKDRVLCNFLYKSFNVLCKITLKNAFLKEYGINVETDIVILSKKQSYYGHGTPMVVPDSPLLYDADISSVKDVAKMFVREYLRTYRRIVLRIAHYEQKEIEEIPDLSRLIEYEDNASGISITANGISGCLVDRALLDFYDESGIETYNPVAGRPTGITQAYFSVPSLIRNGVSAAINIGEKLGLNVYINEQERLRFNALREKWRYEATPLYQPHAHEMLAYYRNEMYQAKKTLRDSNGHTIYGKGKQYLFRPTWVRAEENVSEEEKKDSKGEYVESIKLDRGYLQINVASEVGVIEYPEFETKIVAELVDVFGLPEIKSVSEAYPEKVEMWARAIAKRFPFLFDYQAEDLSRILTKKTVYIGFEMGAGKTVMAYCYASLRQYQRTLIVCQGSLVDNWCNEAEKFGFIATPLKDHSDIDTFIKRCKSKDFKPNMSEFFIIGQEFLSLDGGRIYNEWNCVRYDGDGEKIHDEICTKQSCSRGHKYETQIKACPQCSATYDNGWTGRYCHGCGYVAYSYGTNAGQVGTRQYPAYKRLKKWFTCVITDESQNYANRSLRGEASRALKAKSRMMLTGTIMKNYVSDVFLNFGWLVGYDNPVFYFGRQDAKIFLDEFGSYEIVSKEYLSEMGDASVKKRKQGRKKLLPAVSNLSRFWRLITPFTVRRLSDDIAELKSIPRERQIIWCDMDMEHMSLYGEIEEWAKKTLNFELSKETVNMGVVSMCLWKLRFAATIPVSDMLLMDEPKYSYPNVNLPSSHVWCKINELTKIIRVATEKKEKVIVFSGLRDCQSYVFKYLKKIGYKVKLIDSGVQTNDRFYEIQEFSDNGYQVLVTGSNVLNRGYTITAANHVVFMDLAYTPEITDQAEYRCIRPGQKKKVQIYYLLTSSTIDSEMFDVNKMKREAIQHAMNKVAKYDDIADLLKQADMRNPEVAIAKKILEAVRIKMPEQTKVIDLMPTHINNDEMKIVCGKNDQLCIEF
jgi:hypothetical protein